MVKVILFDLGGVVMKSDWKGRNEAMKKECGVSVLLNPEIKELYDKVCKGKLKAKDLFKKLLEVHGVDKKVDDIMEAYMRKYKEFSSVDEDVLNLVKVFARNPIALAVG